jgi:hypothetical protein
MENGCKYNEGISSLYDSKSLIFEFESVVKQIHENQKIFWETNYTYVLSEQNVANKLHK